MCSIYMSYDEVKFESLRKLNSSRGDLASSKISLQQKFFIGHSQAPTSKVSGTHPAINGQYSLWHNGILKEETCPSNIWDTQFILDSITIPTLNFELLSSMNGSFACILLDRSIDRLWIFRNEIAPLFMDTNYNFSSTPFPTSVPLPPNFVFQFDPLSTHLLNPVYQFTTKENPYLLD